MTVKFYVRNNGSVSIPIISHRNFIYCFFIMNKNKVTTTSKRGRILLTSVGTLFVGIGILGIFLPILPTTPFLLLAAACFARSSQRFYDWLLNNRWFGNYIRNYREGKGLPLKQKVIIIILLWVVIGFSAALAVHVLWVKIVLILIAIGVSIHILSLRTLKP